MRFDRFRHPESQTTMNTKEMLRAIAGDHDPVSNVTTYSRYRAETNFAEAVAASCPVDADSGEQQRHFESEIEACKAELDFNAAWVSYVTRLLMEGRKASAITTTGHAS